MRLSPSFTLYSALLDHKVRRMTSPARLQRARRLLCSLQDSIRAALVEARRKQSEDFSRIAAKTAADTIYAIDRISEEAIVDWFTEHWPRTWPVQVVMEGIEDDQPLTFPKGTPVERTEWKCILDPIDGTRGLMYDKRPAWILAGLAPQRGKKTSIADIVVAAMTELPITKQWRSDQYSAVRQAGLQVSATDMRSLESEPLRVRPSTATHFEHGFSSFAKFFPAGTERLSRLEETFWRALHGSEGEIGSPIVFNDQYISTGGQLHEILCGHDRMIADIRPFAFAALGLHTALVCHPYDICTALLLEEAGGVIDDGLGRPLRAPLDTTSPVSWVAYANPTLARRARPVLKKLIQELQVEARDLRTQRR